MIGAVDGPDQAIISPSSAQAQKFDKAIRQSVRDFYPDEGGFSSRAASYQAKLTGGRWTLHGLFAPGRRSSKSARGDDSAPPAIAHPISFETTSIGRSGSHIPLTSSAVLDDAGGVSLRRGAIIERLLATPEGMSQSWEIPARPEGEGDLFLRIQVEGQSYAGETAGGLHFVDPKTGLGTVYGHGTWIDASGSRTRVAAHYVDGSIELRVPAAVVQAAAYPAVLDPIVGPEFGIDEPVQGPSGEVRGRPEIVSDGAGTSLVVWTSVDGLFGARLSANGDVLDPAGFRICPKSYPQGDFDLTFDGTNFVLVWQRQAPDEDPSIYAARIGLDGAVLDPDGFRVTSVAGVSPSIASDGSLSMVVYATDEGIHAVRLDADGTVLDPNGRIIYAQTEQEIPKITYNGTNYLVVWKDALGGSSAFVRFTRVTPDGEAISPLDVAATVPSYRLELDVASAGSEYHIIYRYVENQNEYEYISGRRVESDGGQNGGFSLWSTAEEFENPRIASSGSDYFVTWSNYGTTSLDVYGFLTSVLPTYPGPLIRDEPSMDYVSSVAFDGTNFWVLHQHDRTRPYPFQNRGSIVYGNRVSPTGEVIDTEDIVIAAPQNSQDNPDVASDGTNFLVVWQDNRDGENSIYAGRVDASGTLLDPSGFPVSVGADARLDPSVAFNGSEYLVVWEDYRAGDSPDLYGRRLGSDGAVLDAVDFPISTAPEGQYSPDVTSNGTDFFVVWQDYRTGIDYDVYGALITDDVASSEPPGIPIAAASITENRPKVTSDGVNFFAVWQDRRNGPDFDIYGARLGPSGALLDPNGIPLSLNTDRREWYPDVSFAHEHYFAVWQDGRSGAGDNIYGARITSQGTLLDAAGVAVTTAPDLQAVPVVTPGPLGWVTVWQDEGSSPELQLFGTEFRESIDTFSFEIPDAVPSGSQPALATNSEGTVLLVYTTNDPEPRTVARLLTNNCTPIDTSDVTCDGVDDDCDGRPDDDYVAVSTTCGEGVCASTGERTCVEGIEEDSCEPLPKAPEVCQPTAGTGGEKGDGGPGGVGNSPGDGDASGDGDAGDGDAGDGDEAGDGDQIESGGSSASRERRRSSDSGGCDCGCRVSSAPASPLMPWAALGLLSLASLRRRARTSRSFGRRPI